MRRYFYKIDLKQFSENQLIAFYGALIAIAFADQEIAKSEYDLIHEWVNIAQISSIRVKNGIYQYAMKPPSLVDALAELVDLSTENKMAVLKCLRMVVLADGVVSDEEEACIVEAQRILSVFETPMESISILNETVSEKGKSSYEEGINEPLPIADLCDSIDSTALETMAANCREGVSPLDNLINLLHKQKLARKHRDILTALANPREE